MIHGYFILFSNNPVSPVSPMSNNTSFSPPRYVYRKSVKDHLEDIRTITNVTVTTTGKDIQTMWYTVCIVICRFTCCNILCNVLIPV